MTILAFTSLLVTACPSEDRTGTPPPSASDSASTGYNPRIDAADFVRTIDNPWVAFGPGMTTVYRERPEGEHITVRVLADTKTIMGVPCVVVEDIVREDGQIVEKTFDWYAQDRDGNVWYFGEDSTEYENGKPATKAGSWEAGKDGAKPGILMKARPGVGDLYRQEYHVGEAEDLAEVIDVDASIRVGGKRYDDVLVTREWTNLEPGTIELKYYASGTGLIRERQVAGGDGVIDLVSIERA